MQWLINLVLESLEGIIVLWSGAIVDIPTGWTLCDGTLGTPDLRNRFLVGAGNAYNVDDTGGSNNHNHTFTGDGHAHELADGGEVSSGPDYHYQTTTDSATGTTDNGDGRPLYYALAYIMKV